MSWSRETKWRQSSVVGSQHFKALGINCSSDLTIAMAVSHDCDITNENQEAEPFVEFVLGRIVETCNGNFEFGKNPRILHIKVLFEDNPVTLELHAPRKFSICKSNLAACEPDHRYAVDRKQSSLLQDWLAARYRRQALPDSLNARLKKVVEFLEAQGKKQLYGIVGYWLDYCPRDIELPPNEPYELWLYIVYSTDDAAFADVATKTADALKGKFTDLISKTVDMGSVDLRDCEAYSEAEFTLLDLRSNIHYRFEYLSHRTDPPGPVA